MIPVFWRSQKWELFVRCLRPEFWRLLHSKTRDDNSKRRLCSLGLRVLNGKNCRPGTEDNFHDCNWQTVQNDRKKRQRTVQPNIMTTHLTVFTTHLQIELHFMSNPIPTALCGHVACTNTLIAFFSLFSAIRRTLQGRSCVLHIQSYSERK